MSLLFTALTASSGSAIGAPPDVPVAPVISSPGATELGTSTAEGTVTTDSSGGTAYAYVSLSGTSPGATAIRLGTGAVDHVSQAVAASGVQEFGFSGLDDDSTYFVHYLHRKDGLDSNVVTSGSFTTDAQIPVLTPFAGFATGSDSAEGVVLTDTASGTLYGYISIEGSPPDAATLKSSAQATQVISSIGAKTLEFSGLTPETNYYIHFLHNTSGGDSEIVSSGSFTTDAEAPPSGLVADLLYLFEDSSGGTLPHRLYTDPVGDEAQPIELAAGDSEHNITNLPTNTEVEITNYVFVDPDEVSPLIASIWTAPGYAPGLAVEASSENSITVTITSPSEVPASPHSGTGYRIEISPAGDDDWTLAGMIDTGDAELEVTGLSGDTAYDFRALSVNGNAYPHDAGSSDWSDVETATTDADEAAPVVVSLSPLDDADDIAIASNLVITFNEPIFAGTGNVTIKNLTDATQVTIAIGDGQCSIAGSTLTINPTSNLAEGKSYAVQIAATCIKDASDNFFAGILDDTTWNFATVEPAVPEQMIGTPASAGIQNDQTTWLGHTFFVEAPTTVTKLGRLFHTGNSQEHPMEIAVASTGVVIATATIVTTGGTNLQYQFADIEEGSVVLSTGIEYAIASKEFVSGDNWRSSALETDVHPDIPIGGQCYRVGDTGWYTIGIAGYSYGAPNLEFYIP